MREILFRGKRLDNGEWVEGHLHILFDGTTLIISKGAGGFAISHGEDIFQTAHVYEVDPETVGQFTGVEVYKDPHLKTGEDGRDKLFEHDIVRFRDFDYNGIDHERIGIVYWCDGGFYIDCTRKYGEDAIYSLGFAVIQDDCIEVIGNRWDNPELLEVDKNA